MKHLPLIDRNGGSEVFIPETQDNPLRDAGLLKLLRSKCHATGEITWGLKGTTARPTMSFIVKLSVFREVEEKVIKLNGGFMSYGGRNHVVWPGALELKTGRQVHCNLIRVNDEEYDEWVEADMKIRETLKNARSKSVLVKIVQLSQTLAAIG